VGLELAHIDGGHLVVSLRTTGAQTSAGPFAAALQQALTRCEGHVVVDMANLEWCDREIANALVGSRDELAARGRRMVLVNVGMLLRRQLAALVAGDSSDT
jgi:anti-anti-sigma regulatory factor